MIGGRRRINALGADDIPLQWSGLFLFASAVPRARFLDSVRREGLQCTLSWDQLRYQVVIDQFRATYKYPFRVPYWISFEVIQDQTATVDSVPAVTPAQSLATDMARMGTLSNCLGDSTLNGLVGDLQSAMSDIQAAAQPIANGLKRHVVHQRRGQLRRSGRECSGVDCRCSRGSACRRCDARAVDDRER
ncbi:hypothetical protein [Paraburkholderia sp. SOS3]|uniref:hypothetical protein n=1 Tax=Paraburkholderia sp. SOS3 TaxID=1926494 RepID=UPI000947343F|nr:hypothetical protein [Paraburkholderia sp. SOS3]APR40497.1 hypothetical protein BTO02_33695 [Paraburkholderia sp. SOS3]